MNEFSVTICILTFNSSKHIGNCIESVLRQTYPNIFLRIIDNCSIDGTVEDIKSRYPEVPLTVLTDNIGFARAHNLGIRQSTTPFYLPLNPDVILEENYIYELVNAMNEDKELGCTAGKLLFMMQQNQKTAIIYSTGHLLTKSRSPSNRGYKQSDRGQFNKAEPVFAVNGAAPLYRREMLDDISLDGEFFCERFFMYGEDHDIGWRAQLRNWRTFYNPNAVGYHVGYGSGGVRSFRIQKEFTRNRYLTLVRNDLLVDFLLDLPYILLYEFIWQLVTLVRNPGRLPGHWAGIISALLALSEVKKDRKIIQETRLASSAKIRSFFVPKLW